MPACVAPPMLVRSVVAGGFVRVDEAFHERTGLGADELAAASLLDWIDPADQPEVRALLEHGAGVCTVRHRARTGASVPVEVRLRTQGDDLVALVRVAGPPQPPSPAEDEAPEATVSGTLATIARILEEQNPGYKCSILLVEDGRFVSGAGPSLPDAYNAAIDGYAVGPFVGSCGTAIYWDVPVVATNLQTDPLWAPFAELTREAGVWACWSHPFSTRGGRVLGALAFYAPEPRAPTPEQLVRLRAAARMTGLAVERGRAEQALRDQRARELELEEQLRQAAKMEALGVLAGGLAHDFNNVLATILANAELALDLQPQGPVAPLLRDIVQVTRHAGGFCQQMLAYAGRGEAHIARLELGALLPHAVGLAQAAVSKKVRLDFRLHEQPLHVEGDENQLLQVVLNLVTNAAEAIGEASGTITLRTERATFGEASLARLAPDAGLPAGSYAVISVRDDGCGMDAATRSRIFDPFFTTKFTGRGLGLAAVRGIVTQHRGAIRLESAPGEGTTFTILLPVVAAGPPEAAVVEEPVTVPARQRVLVVDDEPRLRAALRRRLTHAGYEVVEAEDGQQALERFREQPEAFDCVLLDLSMPALSGEEVHAELVGIRPEVPVVAMSGYAHQEVLERFETVTLAGFLQKPIASDELLRTLRKATAG